MEESRFRNKVTWFTFCFSILVIWIHSANAEIFLGRTEQGYFLYELQNFIGNVVAQIAVPGFFMMSAYLFYRGFSLDKLKAKWYSRIRTILVPFVLWNFLYYLGYVVASRIDGLKTLVGKESVPFNLAALCDGILHYTYNYVFWYLYQLILLILLAPVIYLVIKNKYWTVIAVLAILVGIQKGFRLIYLNLDALLYYGTAAWFSLNKRELAEKSWTKGRMTFGCAVGAGGIISLMTYSRGMGVVFLVLFRLLLPIGLWLITDEKKLPPAREWMKETFFLYAIHYAFVRLINKTGARLLPGVVWVPMVLYFLMPLVCVLISRALAAGMKKICPPLWLLLTGGRT